MSDKLITLKQGQIDVLELLYKYRFSSRQLILESMGEGSGTDFNLYKKLEVLIKHGLVFKRHEPRQNCWVCHLFTRSLQGRQSPSNAATT